MDFSYLFVPKVVENHRNRSESFVPRFFVYHTKPTEISLQELSNQMEAIMRKWIIIGEEDYDPSLGLILIYIFFIYVFIVVGVIYLLYKLIEFLVKRFKKRKQDKIQEQQDFTINYSIGNREELKRLLQILHEMYKSGAIEHKEYEELKIEPLQVLTQYNYDSQTREGRKALKVINKAISHWENTLQHIIEYNNMRIKKTLSMDEYLKLKTPLMEKLYIKKIVPSK